MQIMNYSILKFGTNHGKMIAKVLKFSFDRNENSHMISKKTIMQTVSVARQV